MLTNRFVFLLWLFATTCALPGLRASPDSIPYNLEAPNRTIELANPELREISGLSPFTVEGIFLGIEDEKGLVFFVNTQNNGAIERRVQFREKGDFEGIEFVGGCLYAVQSNGDIYEIDKWDTPDPCVQVYKTALKKSDDIEGLAFDSNRKSLLLACKGNPDSASIRKIFAFDLVSKKLGTEPVYSIDPKAIDALIPKEKDSKSDYFSPSGIAIHPQTQDVYVLSSAKKRLAVLDYRSGALKYVVKLSKKLLPQPEGIAFDKTGTLIISSEGKDANGLLQMFNPLFK